MCFANAGIPVHIIDQDENNLERGVAVIKGNYDFMMSVKGESMKIKKMQLWDL